MGNYRPPSSPVINWLKKRSLVLELSEVHGPDSEDFRFSEFPIRKVLVQRVLVQKVLIPKFGFQTKATVECSQMKRSSQAEAFWHLNDFSLFAQKFEREGWKEPPNQLANAFPTGTSALRLLCLPKVIKNRWECLQTDRSLVTFGKTYKFWNLWASLWRVDWNHWVVHWTSRETVQVYTVKSLQDGYQTSWI